VNVKLSTEGLYKVGVRSWGDVGIVGRGVGSEFTVGDSYVIRKPSDAKDLFGESSALYNSILLLFSNGATKVIVVPAAVTAQSQETFSGDANQTEFTLSEIPAQPMDSVQIASVPQIEGEDFYVDYGNKKVIFYDPPASGTDNITIDYSLHTLLQVQNALTVLEDEDVQLVLGAMMFDSALLGAIKTHCIAMENESPRLGIYMLKNGETDTTLATTLGSKLSTLIAHKSLKDKAAALCGLIAGLKPWEDLTMRPLLNTEQSSRFTSTQVAAFDAVHIITAIDPPKLTGNAFVVSTGWTLDGTGSYTFIDQIRTAHHIASVISYGITNPNVIGKMRMNRNGLRELDSYMRSLLNPWVKAGAIDGYDFSNPAKDLFELDNPNSSDIAEIQALQASRRLEGAYIIRAECIYSGTIIYIDFELSLVGGVA